MIRGILFDFGETLDTGGDRWMHILYDIIRGLTTSYDSPVDPQLSKELYKKAFDFGEQALARKPIIGPKSLFFDVIFEMVMIQIGYIIENSDFPHNENYTLMFGGDITNRANKIAMENCKRHGEIIKALKANYKIGLVSNSYGNLRTILRTFKILPLFDTIIESTSAGVKKPDPAIFKLGCKGLGLAPEECLVVGASLDDDIRPALSIGCKAFWLGDGGWDEAASIKSLTDIQDNVLFDRIKNLEEITGKLKSDEPV